MVIIKKASFSWKHRCCHECYHVYHECYQCYHKRSRGNIAFSPLRNRRKIPFFPDFCKPGNLLQPHPSKRPIKQHNMENTVLEKKLWSAAQATWKHIPEVLKTLERVKFRRYSCQQREWARKRWSKEKNETILTPQRASLQCYIHGARSACIPSITTIQKTTLSHTKSLNDSEWWKRKTTIAVFHKLFAKNYRLQTRLRRRELFWKKTKNIFWSMTKC